MFTQVLVIGITMLWLLYQFKLALKRNCWKWLLKLFSFVEQLSMFCFSKVSKIAFVLCVSPYLQSFSQPHAVCEDAAWACRLLDLPHRFTATVPHELHTWAKTIRQRRPQITASYHIYVTRLRSFVLTIHLVRFEFGDKVLVHLHHRLLGFFIFIQQQFGGDGTDHRWRLIHHNFLRRRPEQRIKNSLFSFKSIFIFPHIVTYSQN